MRSLLNYDSPLSQLSHILINKHSSDIEKGVLRSSVDQLLMSNTIKVRVSGAERMDRIIYMATNIPGYTMTYFQLCCLHAILPIVAPIVFKGCSAQDLAEYFRKTNMEMTRMRLLFLQTSRRSGKTDLLTILAAIFLIVIPNLEALCWSLYNETSELFGRTVTKWVTDFKYKKFTKTARTHVIITMAPNDIRSLYLMGSLNPDVNTIYIFIYLSIYIFLYTRHAHPTIYSPQ